MLIGLKRHTMKLRNAFSMSVSSIMKDMSSILHENSSHEYKSGGSVV